MSRYVKLFHPFVALIASATEHELAKYVQYLKEENKIRRAAFPASKSTLNLPSANGCSSMEGHSDERLRN